METVKAELAVIETVKDLKHLLTAKPPCLSVYMPLSKAPVGQAAKTNGLQWKETIGTLKDSAARFGPEGKALLESVADFSAFGDVTISAGKSLAVFRSADLFQIAVLQSEMPSLAHLNRQFVVRPLLKELLTGKSFYLLALSQNDVRLLHCTLTSSEEVRFSKTVATSFDAYQNSATPDHARSFGASAGPGSGSSRGIVATSSSEREGKDQYLLHFFKQIDGAVGETLRGKTAPLITAGVDYELSLYRSVNSYPHLLEESVHGAPNGLKAGEMHARAIQALGQHYEKRLDGVLAEYDHKVGSGASNRLKDVVTAAHDGRVLTLVVSDTLTTNGSFDEATHEVSGGRGADDDLVNDAVVQTLLHAGNVLVAPNTKMPHGAPVAAIFRYQA